jgi:flagellar biosynthetic protein FliR
MSLLELQLGGLLVVFSRVAGLFVFAPLLASVTVPMRIRAILAVTMSLIIWLGLPGNLRLVEVPDVITAGYIVFTETTLGTIIGLIALMPVVAVQLGSAVFGQQMGFGLTAVYNPALETDSDVLGELMLYLALGVFLSFGGLERLFLIIAGSFKTIGPGGFLLSAAPLSLVVGILTAGTELAIRIALPVLCLILVETIASAFVSKTMPQLSVMSLGFGLKVILGIMALTGALISIQQIIGEHIADTFNRLTVWLSL